MRGTVIYGAGDVRSETIPDPTIIAPTDAIVRTVATCVCGSDLWAYRGFYPIGEPMPFGHEYCGIVEAVGNEVVSVKPGQFVVGSFLSSDNSCPRCRSGMTTACQQAQPVSGCQSEAVRVALADGTLVAAPDQPSPELVPSLLAISDVMGTGWYAAEAANVSRGDTVVVVGDGAVGLCGIMAASQKGAERVIAMSRHEPRQRLAREFGATDVVDVRGEEGVERIKELTAGAGADAVLECVGTAESMMQSIRSARPGGTVGFVGMPHGVSLNGLELFMSQVGVRGGPAPVRRFLPHLMDLVLSQRIDPGKVFDMTLPLADVASGYRAMDERRAIKVLLAP